MKKINFKYILSAIFVFALLMPVTPQKAMAASKNFTFTVYAKYYDAQGNPKGDVPFTSKEFSGTITSTVGGTVTWTWNKDSGVKYKATATSSSSFPTINLPHPSELWTYDSDKYTFCGGHEQSACKPSEIDAFYANTWNKTCDGHENTCQTSTFGQNYSFFYIFQEKAQEVTYTLNYDTKGGTPTIAADSKTSSTGSATFTISSTVPSKEGFNFLGWSTTDGGSVEYNPGGSFTTSVQSNTLYAVWEKIILPGKLVITCANLQNGESAVFEVRDGDSNTLYTVSVSSENPSAIIAGIKVGTYSVVPMGWSWTYDTMNTKSATVEEAQTATASFTAAKKSDISEKYGEGMTNLVR